MNLQQLEYILAIADYQHFGRAAEACHVTQPTLSTMVKKLEEELAVRIFDRHEQPIQPTTTGRLILEQARLILRQVDNLHQIVAEQRQECAGQLRIGIIPTLAPYLVPRFLPRLLQRYPGIELQISEAITDKLIQQLVENRLDVAILVSPLQRASLRITPLFYEEFYVYSRYDHSRAYILAEDIDPDKLWLLEEGHCFRSQVLNICALSRSRSLRVEYRSGSIETLKRLVEVEDGLTILPELATLEFNATERARLRPFSPPSPVREVSLAVHQDFIRSGLLQALHDTIAAVIPGPMRERRERSVVEIGD